MCTDIDQQWYTQKPTKLSNIYWIMLCVYTRNNLILGNNNTYMLGIIQYNDIIVLYKSTFTVFEYTRTIVITCYNQITCFRR